MGRRREWTPARVKVLVKAVNKYVAKNSEQDWDTLESAKSSQVIAPPMPSIEEALLRVKDCSLYIYEVAKREKAEGRPELSEAFGKIKDLQKVWLRKFGHLIPAGYAAICSKNILEWSSDNPAPVVVNNTNVNKVSANGGAGDAGEFTGEDRELQKRLLARLQSKTSAV